MFDANLRNTPLDEGQDAPLWLVVRYMMTPFDDEGESDTADAYRVLGDGLRALQSLALLPVAGLQPEDQAALDPNPQRLRLTFNEAPSSLLSTLMQGTDEKYRFSMCFEVRPVMIAPAAPAAYSLLVGVDYTGAPGAEAADGGVGLSVEPTLGPVIDRVTPSSFKAGDPPVRIDGTDLDIGGLEVQLGPGAPPADARRRPERGLRPHQGRAQRHCDLRLQPPVTVVRTLSSGRRRSSNIAVVNLLPELGGRRLRPQGEIDLQGFASAPPTTTWSSGCTATAPPCAATTTSSTPQVPRPPRPTGECSSRRLRFPAARTASCCASTVSKRARARR